MLKAKDGDFFISDWLRNRNTVEVLVIWERVHKPDFNYGEFAAIKNQAGLIHMGLSQGERLNEIAICQMQVLTTAPILKQLKE